jgi:AraC family transcriptional regulator
VYFFKTPKLSKNYQNFHAGHRYSRNHQAEIVMSYIPNVMRAVGFMEQNLTSPISVSDVASEAAYSTFHFVRLFRALTGDTPGSYLRRRRLTEAAAELVCSRRRIIEIAFDYQFQSQEAFTRAFRDCFGISPSAFRKRGDKNPVGTARRIDELFLIHCMEAITMEPRIVKKDALKLIGLMYYGDNKNWEIPKIWEEFRPMMDKIPNRVPGNEAYGVCFYTENFAKNGLFYYLAGVPVSSLDEIPMACVGKTFPASDYAVFTHKGPLAGKTGNIRDTYAYAYGTWLPKSVYVNPHAYDFEFYDERFNANLDNCLQELESEMDIWIPVRKR